MYRNWILKRKKWFTWSHKNNSRSKIPPCFIILPIMGRIKFNIVLEFLFNFRILLFPQKWEYGAGDVAWWCSAYIACLRPWIQSQAPQNINKMKLFLKIFWISHFYRYLLQVLNFWIQFSSVAFPNLNIVLKTYNLTKLSLFWTVSPSWFHPNYNYMLLEHIEGDLCDEQIQFPYIANEHL